MIHVVVRGAIKGWARSVERSAERCSILPRPSRITPLLFEHGGPQDQTLKDMSLNITYAIALSLYALFAYAATLTVSSMIPSPSEPCSTFTRAKRAGIGTITVGLMLFPGVMQHMLQAHPGWYSIALVIILLRLFRKGDPLKCMLSMSLLCSTLILSNLLQRYSNEILEHVRQAIAQPNFLGL